MNVISDMTMVVFGCIAKKIDLVELSLIITFQITRNNNFPNLT